MRPVGDSAHTTRVEAQEEVERPNGLRPEVGGGVDANSEPTDAHAQATGASEPPPDARRAREVRGTPMGVRLKPPVGRKAAVAQTLDAVLASLDGEPLDKTTKKTLSKMLLGVLSAAKQHARDNERPVSTTDVLRAISETVVQGGESELAGHHEEILKSLDGIPSNDHPVFVRHVGGALLGLIADRTGRELRESQDANLTTLGLGFVESVVPHIRTTVDRSVEGRAEESKLKPDKSKETLTDAEADRWVDEFLAPIDERHAHVYSLARRLKVETEALRKALASTGDLTSAISSSHEARSRLSLSKDERYFEEMVFNNHHIPGDDLIAEAAAEDRKAHDKIREREHNEQRLMESRGFMHRR